MIEKLLLSAIALAAFVAGGWMWGPDSFLGWALAIAAVVAALALKTAVAARRP